jgi:hypothetical protein
MNGVRRLPALEQMHRLQAQPFVLLALLINFPEKVSGSLGDADHQVVVYRSLDGGLGIRRYVS